MGDLVKAECTDEGISTAHSLGFKLDAQELLALTMHYPGNSEIAPDSMPSTPMERDVWLSCWKNTFLSRRMILALSSGSRFGLMIVSWMMALEDWA